MSRILLVEDDKNLSYLVKSNLEQEGFTVHCSTDGQTGWNDFNRYSFDLCILDVMLPKQDGYTLAECSAFVFFAMQFYSYIMCISYTFYVS